MKILRCRDTGFDCDYVVRAASEEDVLWEVVEHVREVHHIEVTLEMAEQVEGLIQEEWASDEP